MRSETRLLALVLAVVPAAAPAAAGATYGLGRPVSAAEAAAWDIDVRPDGTGLPAGRGDVATGEAVFADRCADCHGDKGEGGAADRLVGGEGSLASAHPVKTVGSYWPYATTLFDYIRRAMPYTQPQSLAPGEVYALTAYLLWLNGIVPRATTLDQRSLPLVRMPNRDGFVNACAGCGPGVKTLRRESR